MTQLVDHDNVKKQFGRRNSLLIWQECGESRPDVEEMRLGPDAARRTQTVLWGRNDTLLRLNTKPNSARTEYYGNKRTSLIIFVIRETRSHMS